MLPWFCNACSKRGTCESLALGSIEGTLSDDVLKEWQNLKDAYDASDKVFSDLADKYCLDDFESYDYLKEVFNDFERKRNSLMSFERERGISTVVNGVLLSKCEDEVGKNLLEQQG